MCCSWRRLTRVFGQTPSSCRYLCLSRTPVCYLRPLHASDTPVATAAAALARFGNETETIPVLPGAGLAKTYLEAAPPSTTALLQFCAEGDNRGDAYELAQLVAKLTSLPAEIVWKEPQSWTSLFGGAPEPSLYG